MLNGLKWLMAAILLLAAIELAAAQEMTVAAAGAINMRAGPGTQHRVVGKLTTSDTDIFQMARDGDWVRINKGGWVNARLLERRYPVQPRPAPAVNVRPPDAPETGSLKALSPQQKYAFYLGAAEHFIADTGNGDVLRRLVSFERDAHIAPGDGIHWTYQFLSETLLVATSRSNGDWRDRSDRQIIVDLDADRVIYDGSTLFFGILHPANESGFDKIVHDAGIALLLSDPETLETTGFVSFQGIFPGWKFTHRESWVRLSGYAADGTPEFLMQAKAPDGRRAILNVDARGRTNGTALYLDEQEYLFDAFPQSNRFVTIRKGPGTWYAEESLAEARFRQPIASASEYLDVKGGLEIRLREMSGDIVQVWPASEGYINVRSVPAQDNLYFISRETEKRSGRTRKMVTRVAVTSLKMRKFEPWQFGYDKMLGIAPLQEFARSSKKSEPDDLRRISIRSLDEGTVLLGSVDNGNAVERYFSLNLNALTLNELDEASVSALDVVRDISQNSILWSSYSRAIESLIVSRADDGSVLLQTPSGKRISSLKGLYIPEMGSDAEYPTQVFGSSHWVVVAYGQYDYISHRADWYVELPSFRLSEDGSKLFAFRYWLCQRAGACETPDNVSYSTNRRDWENRLSRQLVAYDIATGEMIATLPAEQDCYLGEHQIQLGAKPEQVLFRACRGKTLMQADWETGETREALGGRFGNMGKLESKHDYLSNYHLLKGDRFLLVTGNLGPSLSVYDTHTAKLLADIYIYADGGWVMLTTDGFYTAGGKGDERVQVAQGLRGFTIDRFRSALFRPDLVFETLSGDPERIVAHEAENLSLPRVMASGEVPRIDFDVKAAGASAEIRTALEDAGGGIGTVEIRINGVVRHRSAGRPRETVTVELAQGENAIQLVARNEANLIEGRSDVKTVTVAPEDVAPPRLFILSAGVNDYQIDALDLKHAVSDAERMASAFDNAGAGLYDEIFTTVLSDSEVTRENLATAFDDIAKLARPNDVFVFFMAGHGKTVDGRYHFVPADFSGRTVEALRQQGIGQSTFAEWFAKVPAQNSLLLFDTCDSGSLVETTIGRNLANSASSEMMGNAIGRAILSASSSYGYALEGFEGSGLFTHVVIDGLNNADRNADGLIDVFELAEDVAKKLPAKAREVFDEDQTSAFQPPMVEFVVAKSR